MRALHPSTPPLSTRSIFFSSAPILSAFLLVAGLGCADDAPVAPSERTVKLALAVKIAPSLAQEATDVEIGVFYRQANSTSTLPVTPSRVRVTVGIPDTVALRVNIGPCLKYLASRQGESPARGCELEVNVRLLSGKSVLASNITKPQDPVKPGDTVDLPPVALVAPQLAVSVTGLPDSVAAKVTVKGEDFEQMVTHDQVLINLVPGAYVVSADTVTSGDITYIPDRDRLEVEVPAGRDTSVTITYGTPETVQLVFLQEPSKATAGAVIAPPVRVAIQNSKGQTITTYSTAVSLALGNNPTGATITGNGPVTPVNGVATFDSLTVSLPGTSFTLLATSDGLPADTSTAFDVTASPSLSALIASPDTIRAGSVTTTISVIARDASGRSLRGLAVTLTATGSGNTLVQPVQPTNVNGVTTGLLSSTVSEVKTISAMINGTAIAEKVDVTVVPGIVFVDSTSKHVIAVNPSGSDVTPISALPFAASPRWSPDRRRVAFVSGGDLVLAAAVGDSGVVLASGPEEFRWPQFSPNGIHLAFECVTTPFPRHVCVIPDVTGPLPTLRGNEKLFVTTFTDPDSTSFSPFAWDPTNPDHLAVVRDSTVALDVDECEDTPIVIASQIFIVNYDGSQATPLSAPLIVGCEGLRVGDLDWSPDGSYLVLSLDAHSASSGIYRIARDGSNLTLLASSDSESQTDLAPVVSPDGTRILFLRTDISTENWNYFIVGAGGGLTQLSNEVAPPSVAPDRLSHDWSPDGSEIVLVGTDTSGSDLVVYTVPEGTTASTYDSRRKLVSGPGNAIQPHWRP